MDFLFNSVKNDLIDTLETLEEDINLQKRQVNELIEDNDRKEKYITDDVNIVKSILDKLDYKELKALQSIFYEMENHFYMMNRTEEEQQEFVKGLAEDINDMGTATFDFS
jgi:hypothetical protein